MSGYIGSQPADSFLSISSQQITGNGGATYTLNLSVTSPEDVAVFVNNVRQNPNTYSVSNNQITLGGTISSSDSCYVIFLGKTLATVNPPNASVGASQLVDASITSGKLASGVLPDNTPAFWSYATGTTSLPNSTGTKITNLTDYIDTNNAFASSRFTVGSGQDGKYVFFGTLSISTNTTILVGFGLNGTTNPSFLGGYDTYHELNSERGNNNSIIFNLVAGDYVELYGYQASGGSVNANAGRTRFYGYKLI